MNATDTTSSTRLETADFSPRLPLIGLLVIQLFLGYEWLMSGVTKLYRGGFPSGLAGELTEKSQGAAGWYTRLLDWAVIPNASAFGYLIEIGELLVGAGLIAAALVWMLWWDRPSDAGRVAVALVTVLAAAGGILMNLSFHLANGSPHPWLIPSDGFDEGVDLDSLMPMIQLVLIAVSVGALHAVRRARPRTSSAGRIEVAQGGTS